MKKLLIISLLIISPYCTSAQAKAVKDEGARKGIDTLPARHYLTHQQTLDLYSNNIQLGNQERELNQKYNGTDSLGLQMKKLEAKKDELYKTILPNDKYQLFKQKKLLVMSSANEEMKL